MERQREIIDAIQRGDTSTVAELLAGDPHLAHLADDHGKTALHWAAINGHRQTVDLLLTRGARRDLRDARFDATPREWALEGGHLDISEIL